MGSHFLLLCGWGVGWGASPQLGGAPGSIPELAVVSAVTVQLFWACKLCEGGGARGFRDFSFSARERNSKSTTVALFCLILFGSLRAARPGHEMSFKG
jgi:hypothetical protein